MRIGVTGASGYVGRAVLRRLLGAGRTVTALVRDPARVPLEGVRAVRGDVRDPMALAELAEACDAAVHAAAWVHRPASRPGDRAECFAVNEGGTHALIEALERTGRKPHLVHVSTTAVYGPSHADVAEDAPARPVTAYGESKLAAERRVLEASRRGAVTACVLRPGVVYGPHAPGNASLLLGLVRRGLVPRVAGAANRKSMVHVDDLAEAILQALERPDVVNGRAYNVAATPIATRELVEALAQGLGVRARWMPVPAGLARAAALGARAVSRAAGGRVPDLGRLIEAFTAEATVDARAIEHDLGIRFRPTAPAIATMARE